jgi:hypothetical protein
MPSLQRIQIRVKSLLNRVSRDTHLNRCVVIDYYNRCPAGWDGSGFLQQGDVGVDEGFCLRKCLWGGGDCGEGVEVGNAGV